MRRIRVYEYGGPEVLGIEDADAPVPGPGEVRVRVKAAGVNPYDTYARSGTYGARTPALPYTPGSDAAGVVEALGADVTRLRLGDRVYTTGTLTGAYAELAVCRQSQLVPLPENVTFAQGAAVFVPYATAYRALIQIARAQPTDTILIHGASGGVGLAAIQLARAAGLEIIGTAGSDEGLQLIRTHGAHHAFNHRVPGYIENIKRITNGRGVDVVLEMLANVNLDHDLKMLANGGRVVVVGSRGNVEIMPRDLMTREASIAGVMVWNTPERELAGILRAVNAGLENGSLGPVVGREFPLQSAPEAHRRILEPGALGKIVLLT